MSPQIQIKKNDGQRIEFDVYDAETGLTHASVSLAVYDSMAMSFCISGKWTVDCNTDRITTLSNNEYRVRNTATRWLAQDRNPG